MSEKVCELFDPAQLYSASEVAERLGASKASVYNWARRAGLPKGIKLGKSRRFEGAALNEWIAANRVRSQVEGAA